VLGVVYKGLSFPVLWTFLGDKRGNSHQQERIELLQRFIQLFGSETIAFLTADREFIGDIWWKFLIDHKIHFFIRMRENMNVYLPHKGLVKAFCLFNNLPLNTIYQCPKVIQVKGNWVYLSGMKYVNEKGHIEYLIVACYDNPIQALELYRIGCEQPNDGK
jgi:hypothetical protein